MSEITIPDPLLRSPGASDPVRRARLGPLRLVAIDRLVRNFLGLNEDKPMEIR